MSATLDREKPLARHASFESAWDQVLHSHGARVSNEVTARLERDAIYFGGALLPTFVKPHIMARELEMRWARLCEVLMRSLDDVGRRLLEDADLREKIGFPDGADELLDIEPGYSSLAVIARPDMVWAGAQPRLIEVNTDSPAMMTFTDRLEEMLLSLEPLRTIAEDYGVSPRSRTRGLLEAILACYRERGGGRDDPTIAIVDWKGEMTANELLHTAAVFEELGCPSMVCDPRELTFERGRLQSRGRTIDIVQRRVLFPDFLRRRDELEPLVRAYREGAVCMTNSLRSFVLGNKVTLALMSSYPSEFGLSEEVSETLRDLVPETILVGPEHEERLCREKEKWVLKGAFGSGGKDVAIGADLAEGEWRDIVRKAQARRTIAQQFQTIPTYKVPHFEDGAVRFVELYANWNPWVFSGKYAGATTRVSARSVVGITGGGGLLPCISA